MNTLRFQTFISELSVDIHEVHASIRNLTACLSHDAYTEGKKKKARRDKSQGNL